METVQGGKIDFDRCIATPDMMADRRVVWARCWARAT